MRLVLVQKQDIELLVPLASTYHQFDTILLSDSDLRAAILPLLERDSPSGRIWLIKETKEVIGYIVICFGYLIEFGGRDVFVDEFFIVESARRKGFAIAVLKAIKDKASYLGLAALLLEVAQTNHTAIAVYTKAGFSRRNQFYLMSCKL